MNPGYMRTSFRRGNRARREQNAWATRLTRVSENMPSHGSGQPPISCAGLAAGLQETSRGGQMKRLEKGSGEAGRPAPQPPPQRTGAKKEGVCCQNAAEHLL